MLEAGFHKVAHTFYLWGNALLETCLIVAVIIFMIAPECLNASSRAGARGEEHDLTSGLVICLLRKAPIYSILVYILQSLPGLENAGYTLADRKATEECVRSGTLATNHTHQIGMHREHQGLKPTYRSEDLSW